MALKREVISGGRRSWLGSKHGVSEAQTFEVDATKFTGGVLSSGTPVAVVGGKLVPYKSDGSGGSEKLVGFVVDDNYVSEGEPNAAVLLHGQVIVKNLPVEFTAPADPGQFIYR